MIRKTIDYQKTVYITADVFRKHSHYLKPGSYVMANERFISKNDPQTLSCLRSLTYSQRLFGVLNWSEVILSGYRQPVKRFLFPRNLEVLEKEEVKKFNGTIFYLPAAKKSVKIFDFIRKQVLTVYEDTESHAKYIDNYNYFHDYFKIPRILYSNLEERVIIEEIIGFKHKSKWTQSDDQMITEKVFNTYKNYYSYCLNKGSVFTSDFAKKIDTLKKDPIISELACMLEQGIPTKMLDLNIPYVKQHGDISPSNILLSEDKDDTIYFIDWEHAGDYVFFFDLLKRMDIEAVKYDNDSYLEKYKNGEMDNHFESIFEMFGMKFDKKHRIAYYFMYISDYFFGRVLGSSISRKESVRNRYIRIITELLIEK